MTRLAERLGPSSTIQFRSYAERIFMHARKRLCPSPHSSARRYCPLPTNVACALWKRYARP
jgi:hypothetical protein